MHSSISCCGNPHPPPDLGRWHVSGFVLLSPLLCLSQGAAPGLQVWHGAPADTKVQMAKSIQPQRGAKQNTSWEWRRVVQQPGPPMGCKKEFVKEVRKKKKPQTNLAFLIPTPAGWTGFPGGRDTLLPWERIVLYGAKSLSPHAAGTGGEGILGKNRDREKRESEIQESKSEEGSSEREKWWKCYQESVTPNHTSSPCKLEGIW